MKRLLLLTFIMLQGCVVSPSARAPTLHEASPNCPPLPTLPPGATRFEERLLNETVRALYAQCAESKK